MLVGLPCSGKSTWRNNLITPSMDFEVLSSDDMIEAYAKANHSTYNEVFETFMKLYNVDAILADKAKEIVNRKHDIVWDQTNLTKKVRAKKIKMLSNIPGFKNYEKIAVVFPNDIETLLNRNVRTGKIIPHSIMRRMAEGFEEPTLDEGFDQIVYN
jgi:predicted kinase